MCSNTVGSNYAILFILLRPSYGVFASSGHSILVNFSETSHVTVISLDVLYRAHSGLHMDTKCLEVSS